MSIPSELGHPAVPISLPNRKPGVPREFSNPRPLGPESRSAVAPHWLGFGGIPTYYVHITLTFRGQSISRLRCRRENRENWIHANETVHAVHRAKCAHHVILLTSRRDIIIAETTVN